jgi:hypothetical protein
MQNTDKLEESIQKMVESQLGKLDLPENFDSVKVDVLPTAYGYMAKINILMKTYFSGKESDFFDESMQSIRYLIDEFFGDILPYGIRYSVSTVDNYWSYKLNENMKNKNIIITESRFKSFIEDKLGIDLTGKVILVTNKWELPKEFTRLVTPESLNSYLNRFGPMYSIDIGDTKYLFQDQGDRSVIVDTRDWLYTESEIMEKLGLPPLGVKLMEILNLYV